MQLEALTVSKRTDAEPVILFLPAAACVPLQELFWGRGGQ